MTPLTETLCHRLTQTWAYFRTTEKPLQHVYRSGHPGCITPTLKDPELPPGVDRRKPQCPIFVSKVTSGLISAAVLSGSFLLPLAKKKRNEAKKTGRLQDSKQWSSLIEKNICCYALDPIATMTAI